MTNKKNRTISLDDESISIVEALDRSFNFSDWVEKKIKSELGSASYLKYRKDQLLKEASDIDERIRLLDIYSETKADMDKEIEERVRAQLGWWKETLRVVQKDMKFVDGRWALYKNLFSEKDLKRFDFLKMIEIAKKIIEGEKNV